MKSKTSMAKYEVSKDPASGLWYCHMKGFSHIPRFGSFCKKKSESMEYAKMYSGLSNKVEEIEERKMTYGGDYYHEEH